MRHPELAADGATAQPWPTVPDEALDDLQDRIRRARWPDPWPGVEEWEAGTPPDRLERLATVWSSTYEWRGHERSIAALPWHHATVAGQPLRYLVFPSAAPQPIPIVLTNGWPSSFLELVPLAERLARPQPDSESAFTVVVPALPGFPGNPQPTALPPATPTHELWHQLMHNVLGFERYGAHGGDLGAGIASLLAQAHPEAVSGLHLLAVADPLDVDPATVTPDEQAYLDEVADWFSRDGAYEHQQATHPATLSYGLSDSPVGLLAWILEKYHDWTDRQRNPTPLPDDFILTQATLYWFTNSIGTSFRPYFEFGHGHAERVRRVDVPTALALFPADLAHPPSSWVERVYNLVRYQRMPYGGHFAAVEAPDLLADDLRAFFAGL